MLSTQVVTVAVLVSGVTVSEIGFEVLAPAHEAGASF
jgi:hypothetical protein